MTEKGRIICCGLDLDHKLAELKANGFAVKVFAFIEAAIEGAELSEADVLMIGTTIANPVKGVQQVYAADKHLSVILLVLPEGAKAIKQSVQFAPFVGKNTLVVSLSPDLNLTTICEGAVSRTRQKRSFHRMSRMQEALPMNREKLKLEQLGSFLEHAPIGALLVSDTDRIINYNQQAKKFFASLHLLDVEVTHLFAPKEAATLKAFLHDGHHPEMRQELTVQQRIFEITTTEVFSESAQKHFLILLNDVTELRLESQRIQTILEALPQMAWTADPEGLVTYFTQGWYYYTGQNAATALGMGWVAVIADEDQKKMSDAWFASLQTGKPFQAAGRYRNAKGDYRWHLARATPIRSAAGALTLWVGTCTDIHDQVMQTEELERKVKERTHLLEASNAELEQFAHVSSHDLQEPLRKIRVFGELLKNNAGEALDASSVRYIDKINETAARMSGLLKALLNFTKLHRDESVEQVDLNLIVTQALGDLEMVIAQKGAIIVRDDLPHLNAVPVQMRQLFYNLLNNALKFSREGVPPKIEIRARLLPNKELVRYPHLQPFATYWEIVVRDNGVGFDSKHAERIFTLFQRLHTRSEYEGTGIGLSLVKKVVSNHGGEVFAVSAPGEGAAFHLILPVSAKLA